MRPYFIYILLLSISFLSCSDSADEKEEILQAEPTIVDDLSYHLTLTQTLAGSNAFVITAQNSDPIECLISLSATWNADFNNLNLVSVKDSDCDSTRTIVSDINLEALTERSEFTIQNNEILNEASLELSDSKMTIKLKSTEGLTIDELSINKIPENLAWGYVNLTTSQTRDIEVSYYQLDPKPEDQRTITKLDEGYYGYFNIGDLKSVIIDGRSDYGQTLLLDLDPTNGWSTLTTMLEELKMNNSALEYHFTSADGEVIKS